MMALTHCVRILPLGDSLTQGDGNPSAYRYDLYRLLAGAEIPFRFIGGVCSGDWRLPPDCRYHSGRGGITSTGLLEFHTEGSGQYIPAWADAAREAEVVLLYIGTNDVYRGLAIEEYTARVDSLIDMLYRYNPALSTVFVATMRSRSGPSENQRVMNAALLDPAFVADQATKGRDVRVVDFNADGTPENLPTDYPPDDGHPNADGNRKLAEMWFAAIADRVRELAATLTPADAAEAPSATCVSRELSITAGSGARLCLVPAPGGEVGYLFESSDPAVAEVDEDGTVYGCGEGECTVRVFTTFGRATVGTVGVRVVGVTPDVLDSYPVQHKPALSEEGYTAPEKALRPTADGVCVRYPHWTEGEIVTHAVYPQDGVCIAFDMTAVCALPPENGATLTLSLGEITLSFSDVCTRMTLSVGDRSISFTDPTPPYRRCTMRLVREGDSLTLYRGGIALASLAGLPNGKREAAPLCIRWKDYHAMIHYFYGLTVATKE